jgi:beta-glucosidase
MGLQGLHIVSDCGAIADIYMRHKYVKTEGEASAMAVKAGTDLTCGREYRSLVQAVQDGLISEAEIDIAVKRLMTARFQTRHVESARDGFRIQRFLIQRMTLRRIDKLSLRASRESLVLLKNQTIRYRSRRI